MSTQIAVRLADDLVVYIDALVKAGAGSRAAVVARALTMYQRHLLAERDAAILADVGDYEEFDGLVWHAAVGE